MWEGMTHREPALLSAQTGQTHFLETKHGAMVTRGGLGGNKSQETACQGALLGSRREE